MLLRLMVILRPNVCSLCHPACLLQEEYQFDLDLPHPLVRLLLFFMQERTRRSDQRAFSPAAER